MFNIGSWNIRGLNRTSKQKEIRQVIHENNLCLCAILETHIDVRDVDRICLKVNPAWNWTSNASVCNKGTRIIVGWDPSLVDLMVLAFTDQVIHGQIVFKNDNKSIFCSLVYALNDYRERRPLWNNLSVHKQFVRNNPWVVMGDFNAALCLADSTRGSSSGNIAMKEFNECVTDIEVMDVNCSGLQYTWNQKPRAQHGILKKIDRVMGNIGFLNEFASSHVIFLPYRTSDHSPAILKVHKVSKGKPKPFKFVNIIADKPEFKETVARFWNQSVIGHNMFQVVQKLRMLKKPMRKLLYAQGNIHQKVALLRNELDKVQADLDKNPDSADLREEATAFLNAFTMASLDEERFLKQKAKIDWLRDGDMNTAYFHKVVKAKIARCRINCIHDNDGNVLEESSVPMAFVNHFKYMLGMEQAVSPIDVQGLFSRKLSPDSAVDMVRIVTIDEIKDAMFSIGRDKAPGPDGYTSEFFKKSWDIVGSDVSRAIMDFFSNGQLLKEINQTTLVLLPKVSNPTKVTDFRPIALCNVIYKCISKIIANRIKKGLDEIVGDNQSAFIPGRSISDNILLTQELMHNYHLNRGPPRCAFKIDIQKAYDTVNWKFLGDILVGFGFHPKMIRWIMKSVTSTKFSISINGELSERFDGRRGLRQGDPISPYLFTLVMEVFTLMLKRRIRGGGFEYHNWCQKQKIVNICFADDLILFARGNSDSVKVLKEALDEFKDVSGLVPSISKSVGFFCNISESTKMEILEIMPFDEGHLPIKYLGVPLISTRLRYRDCKVLIEKVQKRIGDWKNKFLSFAGRLQLVKSVLSAMHIYWASVFILPAGTIRDIEKLLNGFLWCQGEMKRGKVKVKWNDVCLPTKEGGLGIRKLDEFNVALMASHIWKLIVRKETLWVKWVHSYKLKNRSFWEVKLTANVTWNWRKLLSIRHLLRNYFWFVIGNGEKASAWFDKWDVHGPLSLYVSNRVICSAGFTSTERLSEIVINGEWVWPNEWVHRFPSLTCISIPDFHAYAADKLMWRCIDGTISDFSVSMVWNTIRRRENEVSWDKLVWSSYCIPRHMMLLWLVLKKRLKTQDRLRQWDVGDNVDLTSLRCLLCNLQQDSHEHLFFECPFSMQVWKGVLNFAKLPYNDFVWNVILTWAIPVTKENKIGSIVLRLVLAATSYFIWQERNNRLHGAVDRNADVLIKVIVESVRLKLASIKFKRKWRVQETMKTWKIAWING